MKLSIFLFGFCSFFLCSFQAEVKPGERAVKKVLNEYRVAGDQNNAEALIPLLHPDFRVVLYKGEEAPVQIIDGETYRMLIDNKTLGGYPRTADFHSVQFVGEHMATARVTLSSPGKPTLENFYSLVKVNSKWQVIQDYVRLVQ